jgi:hypothetical protein
LEGCNTERDSLKEVRKACEETLDVYFYEPDTTERIIPLPDETLDGKKGIIKIATDPQRAFAILLKNYRLNAHMSQSRFQKCWA